MKSRSLCLSMALTSFSLIFSCENAMALSGPSSSRMDPVDFEVSKDLRFVISLPRDGLSKDIPRGRLERRVAIEGLVGYKMLVNDLWDWRGGFWRSVRGSMAIKILVERVPYDVPLECEDGVKNMLRNRFERQERDFFAAGGQEKYLPKFVIDGSILHSGGVRGVKYRQVVGYDAENVVFPITNDTYLEVKFTFLGAGEPSSMTSAWRVAAEKMKDTILGSMSFVGDWAAGRECTAEH